MYDSDQRKILSVLCHGSIFFSTTLVAIGIPIAALFLSSDPVVKDNAKEAINFHFNVWLYGIIIAILAFVTLGALGLILGPILFLFHWGLPILGIVQILNNPDQVYRYPFIFRVF
ncbi:DUF4870 domain-containing protein [Chroococcidiopsis sp. TS-821]|uniref:DUF4870 domain-containing protein n=1 Tax=Chroococcidiopsis sp. TS-821 TaxID=1378066 RepID=UPI000CEE1AA9|nr:DUF4870 domain-containing protein [Chroococcidiopsis sp. TS-821]PPS44292.1 hypothetical protein B1A85_10065 [Chroococcidiopsis sp. TS-821]